MRDVSHDALRSQRLWRCGPAGALARSPARDQIKVLDLKIVKPLRSYSHAMIKAAHDFDRTTQKYDDVMKQHIINARCLAFIGLKIFLFDRVPLVMTCSDLRCANVDGNVSRSCASGDRNRSGGLTYAGEIVDRFATA